mmetsp:Transcript_33765/g.53960  ORF Transcript_33765/g.53960 Transcript_33765/m.53960 type:complete len:96 (-) Transcript_33765:20-307(-)
MGCGATAGDKYDLDRQESQFRSASNTSQVEGPQELVRELSRGAPEKKESEIQLPELPEVRYKPQPPPKIALPEIQGDYFIKVQCITGEKITQKTL